MPLIVKRPWTSQPQVATRVDWGNPLTARITHLLPLNGDPREIVTGARLTYGAGRSIGATARGLSLLGSGVAACASVPLNLSAYTKASVSFWMYWDAYANTDNLAMEFGANYSTDYGFLIDPNSGSPAIGLFQAGVGSPAAANSISFSRPSAAAWHHYVFLFDRTTGTAPSTAVYVDGVAQSTPPAGAVSDVVDAFGNNTLYIFSRANTSLFGAGKMQNLVIRGGYLMTAAEALQEYANPWQLFAPLPRRIWAPGALTAPAALTAAATASATATAALTTAVVLSATAQATAQATGALTTAISLSGAPASQATAAAALTTSIQLAASATAQAQATAEFPTTAAALQAASAATSAATGALTTAVLLAATATAATAATAALTAPSEGLSATAGALSAATGALTTAVQCVAAAVASASATGALTTAVSLVAAVSAASAATAALTVPIIDVSAAAVWAYVLPNGKTAGQTLAENNEMLRIVLAAVSGKTAGIGGATETYFGADGTTPRVIATFDSRGNRVTVVTNGVA